MNEHLEKSITICANRISDKSTPDEALKFSQAALNFAHAIETLAAAKRVQDKTNTP